MAEEMPPGSIVWQDLTVADAPRVRDFYTRVVGWTPTDHPMGDYSDFNMNLQGSGKTIAGICHARGTNANIPPQWLIYIAVSNLEESLRQCRELGGSVLDGPRPMGKARFAVIQDPAGAVAGLIET